MSALAIFDKEALAAVNSEVDRLKLELSFDEARDLPGATGRDIVVAGREVQLTVFRQSELPALEGDVLITVQLARFGLGGMVSYHIERGVVFSPASGPRDATDDELKNSGG